MDRGIARWIAPLVAWATGMVAAFYPALSSGFAELQIHAGDPRLVHYILEHSYLWLVREPLHASFWSPPLHFPATGVGAYSDTMVGAAPFYWIWRVLGIGPSPAYQLWMMACLSLNFVAAYLFLRGARLAAWPAAVGGALYGFGIARVANFNSPQLFPVFYGMFALVALQRALDPENARRGAWVLAFAAALALQMWSAFYPAFFMVFLLCAALIVGLAFGASRERLVGLARARPLAIAGGAVLTAAAVTPMALAHLGATGDVGWRGFEIVERSLPQLASWLYPGGKNLIYGGLRDTALFSFELSPSQHSNGVGFLTTFVFLVGLIVAWRSSVLARVVLVSTLAVVLISTRFPGGFSGWSLVYDWVPGAQAIRYPARIGIYLLLPAALGVAHFLARTPVPVAVLIGLACFAEQLHVLKGADDARYRQFVEATAARIEPDASAFFLMTTGHRVVSSRGATSYAYLDRAGRPQPLNRRSDRLTHIVAMWVGLEAHVPTINGFYGNWPPGWDLKSADIWNPRERIALRTSLDTWIAAHGLDPSSVAVLTRPAYELPWLK